MPTHHYTTRYMYTYIVHVSTLLYFTVYLLLKSQLTLVNNSSWSIIVILLRKMYYGYDYHIDIYTQWLIICCVPLNTYVACILLSLIIKIVIDRFC